MKVCLLTSDARHTPAGERIAALAEAMEDAAVVTTGTADWPGAVHIDEASGAFDAALAFGWEACLHVFRMDTEAHGYVVPELEDAAMWHGDERRLLAALTYDLPLTLIAPSRALAKALEDLAPGRLIVVVQPGVVRHAVESSTNPACPLRVASAGPTGEILARMSEPIEAASLASADVLVAPDASLIGASQAMVAGVVPVVTPFEGHDELITDGENGIVVGFDDVPGAARALDTLARDRELLSRLRDGALRRAESFPDLEDEAAGLVEAVRQAGPATTWPERLLLNARAAGEPIAQERRALDQVLRDQERQILELNAENERLTVTLAQQAPAYRVGKTLEPLWRPLLRLRGKR
jgi:hypothetical protein